MRMPKASTITGLSSARAAQIALTVVAPSDSRNAAAARDVTATRHHIIDQHHATIWRHGTA